MNAKMLPPLGSAFDFILKDIQEAASKPNLIRISFALWGRIEQWWRDHTYKGAGFFGADQIYGVPCLVDLELLGDSYILEAA